MGGPVLRTFPECICVVVMTSVLPSHLPLANPDRVCTAYFDSCRPSIQTVVWGRSDQASMVYDRVVPLIGSNSRVILRPNPPEARYVGGHPSHWWSTMPIVAAEYDRALARPSSLS